MPIPPPDSQFQTLLDKLFLLADIYSYSPLLINIPKSGESQALFRELCLRAINGPGEYDVYWIKETIKDKKGIVSAFLGYVYTAANKLRETKDIIWLEIGAGATMLAADYPDWRDYILAVAELYVTAEECGFDPDLVFAKAGYKEEGYLKNLPAVCERRGYHQ
ncbi:hypothetical protein hrd7_12910 [Leptolinea sp. HRD-7]|nr:hypothetical protein hrd7_12910 [Leptolinea sp. HRD-7]